MWPQVKIDRICKQWSGSLHVGLTTLSVSDSTPHTILPATATQLKSKPTWLATGVDVISCGEVISTNYATSLQRLEVYLYHIRICKVLVVAKSVDWCMLTVAMLRWLLWFVWVHCNKFVFITDW